MTTHGCASVCTRRYEGDFFWWELVEVGRKLALTLILVFFMEGSATQIVATMLVSFAALMLLTTYRPYRADDDDTTAVVAQVGLVLTSFASLLMKVDVTGQDDWDTAVFDVTLVLIILSVPLFACLEGFREALISNEWGPSCCCVRARKALRGGNSTILPVEPPPRQPTTQRVAERPFNSLLPSGSHDHAHRKTARSS